MGLMVNPPKPGDISYEQFVRESKGIIESQRRRARIMTDGFNSCRNVVCNFTEGAIYSFPQIRLPPRAIEAAKRAGKVPDVLYCLKLLEAIGISTVPGSRFGQKEGKTYDAIIGDILIYTMLIVWLLERQSHPEFSGPWKNQISTALWFTFLSLFFAHREKVFNNLACLVIVVWLFVVLILTLSYTASLSSMLTVQQLQPNVADIEWLKKNNLKVGCGQ